MKIKGKNGAGDEIRTHDFNLGKVALYPWVPQKYLLESICYKYQSSKIYGQIQGLLQFSVTPVWQGHAHSLFQTGHGNTCEATWHCFPAPLIFNRLIKIFLIFHSTSCSYSLLQQGFENITNQKIFISLADPRRWARSTGGGVDRYTYSPAIFGGFKPYVE